MLKKPQEGTRMLEVCWEGSKMINVAWLELCRPATVADA